MTVINPKSISGITSITLPSGDDDILTIHTHNGTERLRIDSTGTTKIVTGIVTTLTATTGIVTTLTTNTAKVGTGITLSPDGDVFTTGITTSSSVVVGSGVTISESGIDASGIGITVANINGTSIGGRRNLIINGAFQWAQRTADGSVIVQDENYQTVDRFRYNYTVAPQEVPNQEWHVLVGAGASHDVGPWEEGFRKSYRIQNGNQTAGLGTHRDLEVFTILEAQDVGESGWNYTSSSSFITLQFWVKSSVAQTYYGTVRTHDGTNYNYPFSYALSADTWTKVIKTIPGNSNLQFDTNQNEGLSVNLLSMYGTDYTDSGVSVDTWATYGNTARTPDQTVTWYGTNDATIEFTGVQLEVGSQATPFEHRTKGEELTLCQRYYQYLSAGAYGAWGLIGRKSGSNDVEFNRTLPHPMRAACTGTWTNINGFKMMRASDGSLSNSTAVTLSGAATGSGIGIFQVLNIIADTTSFSTSDVILQYASASSNNQKYELDAEL
tara:strand:- start:602 stop:2089 length:1488 start_codon:yes stop_codon:yes gene_type:complete